MHGNVKFGGFKGVVTSRPIELASLYSEMKDLAITPIWSPKEIPVNA
jgi:hypothetical protein